MAIKKRFIQTSVNAMEVDRSNRLINASASAGSGPSRMRTIAPSQFAQANATDAGGTHAAMQWCDTATLHKHIMSVQATNLWQHQVRAALPLPWADIGALRSLRRCMATVSTKDTTGRRDICYKDHPSSATEREQQHWHVPYEDSHLASRAVNKMSKQITEVARWRH